jgi:hypothetical protein
MRSCGRPLRFRVLQPYRYSAIDSVQDRFATALTGPGSWADTVLAMVDRTTSATTPVPVYVGLERPPVDEEMSEALLRNVFGDRRRRSALREVGFDWGRHGFEPRWLGMDTSDCAAALEPSVFHDQGAVELERFLSGAASRHEIALVVATIGDVEDRQRRSLLATADSSMSLPGDQGCISGARLPEGAVASLATGLGTADRDLGLRLMNGRPPHAPWWRLQLAGYEAHRGGSLVHRETSGQLHPILVDTLGDPVVSAWTSESRLQRWYLIPDVVDWHSILDWLLQRALPELVPGALRRARSALTLDPDLQTPEEVAARSALDELDARYSRERHRLEGRLGEAKARADPMRDGLLYGTGADLENAVASALEAAGLTVLKVDELLGKTASADLLVSHGSEQRLIEVKSVSRNAPESFVGDLERHLRTWPQLRPDDPVTGGALVVNHQHQLDPAERSASVYARPEFVAMIAVPIVATRQLFDWWRKSEWASIRQAVLGQPVELGEEPESSERSQKPTKREGRRRSRLRRPLSSD